MDQPDREDVTILLAELMKGNKEAAAKLISIVYDELRRMAGADMRRDAVTTLYKPPPSSTRLI